MRDYHQTQLEADRPDKDATTTIGFYLRRLFADTEHDISDEVVDGLTFEELIGALLLARDAVEGSR